MKVYLLRRLLALILLLAGDSALGAILRPPDFDLTGFNFEGKLLLKGALANGPFTFRFSLLREPGFPPETELTPLVRDGWQGRTRYLRGDVVTYEGETWLALREIRPLRITDTLPPGSGAASPWLKLGITDKPSYAFLNAWVDGTEYRLGNVVSHEGLLWIRVALADPRPPSVSSSWLNVPRETQVGDFVTADVNVIAGVFTAPLKDFGPENLTGQARWLGVEVRQTNATNREFEYVTLKPAQPIPVAPYAAYAFNGIGQVNWRGPFTALTDYATGDAVSVGDQFWICQTAHQSGEAWDAGDRRWQTASDTDALVAEVVPYALFALNGGAPGPQGPQGIPGAAGPKGDKGDQGAAGAQGLAGPKGEQGDPGVAGVQGPVGPQGLKGDKGDPGAAGPTGATGPQGLAGPAGAKGDKGDPGVAGIQGPAGTQGLKGDKGDAGPTGPQGIQGLKGDTGNPGPQGLTGLTGATGPAGPKGDKGDKGDSGAAGATGPQGPGGPQGLQGIPGSSDGWSRLGNAGTTSANFLGTTDNQPLNLRVNGLRALRLQYGSLGDFAGVNVVGGDPGNFVPPTVNGATVFGGGTGTFFGGDEAQYRTNRVTALMGTVSGGSGNSVSAVEATVGGGQGNTASGEHATVGGGYGNHAEGQSATVPGGFGNRAAANAFAAGRFAYALHPGSFVWADSSADGMESTAPNQFSVRATGGVRFVTQGGGFNVDGTVVALQFNGSGAGLVGVQADTADTATTALNFSGPVTDAQLSANVARRNQGNTFEGNQVIGGHVAISQDLTVSGKQVVSGSVGLGATPDNAFRLLASGTVKATQFVGGGAGLTGVNAATAVTALNFTGPVTDAQLPDNVVRRDAVNTFTGDQSVVGSLIATHFVGDGSGLTGVTAGNATFASFSGASFALRVPEGGGNVDVEAVNFARRDLPNQFLGEQLFAGPVTLSGPLGGLGAQPLEFQANGQRPLRLEYAALGNYTGINTVGGYAGNAVAGTGATVFGGGTDGGAPRPNAATASFATVSGGLNNTAGGELATVAGGNVNQATAAWATVGGGVGNTASGNMATVGGGNQNTASGEGATVPGGTSNAATTKAFAAGTRAKANHPGSFVWADSVNADFASTADNQFLVRAGGGVGINTAVPFGVLGVGTANGQVTIANGAFTPELVMTGGPAPGILRVRNSLEIWDGPGGAGALDVRDLNGVATIGLNGASGVIHCVALNQTSDRNAKENFEPVDARDVLDKVAALPISRWNYKADRAPQHVGPMAQDFHAAFGLGTDERHIATVDADGVALAAIQGLNDKVEQRSRKLEFENAELRRELAELRALVGQLAGAMKEGAR